MARLRSVRLWALIGVLVLGAGMPYCAAAVGWAATQDDTSISIRADVAMGVVIAWIGWTILTVALLVWSWKRLRRRRTVRG
jgi:L-lactate permease